ncbi:hypothetical protein Golob_015003 [Gossypium lobatum]|uniref:Uncharacterized protein n=1 Tax=Gossypium lobatum TaxID=34289 RepID=A0A7J8M0D4_9ROSI|nr:hypothetical protein [Gossypium lobatum]
MENALANLHIDDVKQFGDFVGSFVAYDAKSIANGVSSYINFRVRVDVWHLLKRRKKIVLSQSKQVNANKIVLRELGRQLSRSEFRRIGSGDIQIPDFMDRMNLNLGINLAGNSIREGMDIGLGRMDTS